MTEDDHDWPLLEKGDLECAGGEQCANQSPESSAAARDRPSRPVSPGLSCSATTVCSTSAPLQRLVHQRAVARDAVGCTQKIGTR